MELKLVCGTAYIIPGIVNLRIVLIRIVSLLSRSFVTIDMVTGSCRRQRPVPLRF